MSLLDYIQGIRKGRDANRIEKDALRDAFTHDALEGYDSVRGNHSDSINKLQKQIRNRSKGPNSRNLFVRVASIAAAIILGIGGYMVFDFHNSSTSTHSLSAMNSKRPTAIINIFVPDDFYEEHKTSIIKNNDTAKKKLLSVSVKPFNVNEQITAKVTQEEIEELSRLRNISVIDIYIPNRDFKLNEIEIAKGNNRTEIITEQITSESIDIYVPIEDYSIYKKD